MSATSTDASFVHIKTLPTQCMLEQQVHVDILDFKLFLTAELPIRVNSAFVGFEFKIPSFNPLGVAAKQLPPTIKILKL